ncbi:hypothetical protein ACFL6E_06020 [Candidatus Neomarinimicrobiota bacterium]
MHSRLSFNLTALLLICNVGAGQVVDRIDTLHFSQSTGIDTLRSKPLLPEYQIEEIIGAPGSPVASSQLIIDQLTGQARWAGELTDTIAVIVRYKIISPRPVLALGPAWRYLPPFDSLLNDQQNNLHQPLTKVAYPTTALSNAGMVTSGSLFRGITMSSGHGATLTGGLDLKMQGQLGDDFFVSGTVTDQRIPIEPAGDTRSIDELDRVRLAATSHRSSVEIGDITIRNTTSPMATISRKLEGLKYSYKGSSLWTEGALAGSPGHFRSQTMAGRDGIQGPYHLATDEGSQLLIVLSGTERVWLNGRELIRGENFDYTINYNTGEITFTPRHSIRSDSRIVVDFEYTDLVYRQTTLYNTTGWRGERGAISVTAYSRGDDPGSSLEFSLSEEERDSLAAAGDVPGGLNIATAYLDSSGSYSWNGESYEWRGAGQGTHIARFYNVGGNGEYHREVTDNHIVYSWVPPDQREAILAPYSPMKMLKAPQRHDFVATSMSLGKPGSSRTAQLNLGLSSLDQNRLSGHDDDDNRGLGYDLVGNWESNLGRLFERQLTGRAAVKARGKGKTFLPLGRYDGVEFLRDWDLDTPPTQYDWETAALTLELDSIAATSLELGQINADTSRTSKVVLGMKSAQSRALYHAIALTRIDRPDDLRRWDRAEGHFRLTTWRLTPFLDYESEARQLSDTSGYNIQQVGGGISTKLKSGAQIGLRRELREESFEQSGEGSMARLWGVDYKKQVPKKGRLEAGLTLNEKTYSGSGSDLSYTMGHLAYLFRQPRHPWWIDLRYRLERSVEETKSVVYDSLAAGFGDYRYDENYDVFVPDPNGTFRRLVFLTGEVRPLNAVQLRARGQLQLNRVLAAIRSIAEQRELRLSGRINIEARNTTHSLRTYIRPELSDQRAALYRLNMEATLIQQSERMSPRYEWRVAGRTLIRREILHAETSTLNGESHDNSTASVSRYSQLQVYGVPVTVEMAVEVGREELESLISVLRNHAVDTRQARYGVSRSFAKGISISFTQKYRHQVNSKLSNLTATQFVSIVGVQGRLPTRGRLRIDLERHSVTANNDQPLPLLMAEGFPVGVSWQMKGNGQINLARNLILNMSLFSRRETGRAPFTTINMELRTEF